MTCKRFVFASAVARTQSVTLLSPTAITPSEAYHAFASALDVMGYTVVPRGKLLRIIPANQASQTSLPTLLHKDRAKLPKGAMVVTQLLRVGREHVAALQGTLGQLVGRSGKILAFHATGTLIITDGADNVRRLVRIAEALRPSSASEKMWIVRPKHADASELRRLLEELQPPAPSRARASATRSTPHTKTKVRGSRRRAAPRVQRAAAPALSPAQGSAEMRFVVDERTNALVLIGDDPSYKRCLRLIRLLDVKPGGAIARPWVYALEYGDAEALAGALSGVVGAASGTSAKGGRKAAQAVSIFEGRVQVQAEKTNNVLLIFASARDFLHVREMIRQLDKPRRQVFVEAYVLELSLDGDHALGVAFHGAEQNSSETTFLGGVGHAEGNSMGLSSDSLVGLALGVMGPMIEGADLGLGEGKVPSFGVILQALAKTTDLDVLSAPHLLTTDNEEAEIFVGDTIPVKSGVSGMPITGASDSIPFVNVSREKVGLKLKLTPSIGKGDVVRIKLDQEASSVKEDVGQLGVATGQRTLKTVISVPDGQTVVIGGLVREEEQKSVQKVPLLGDIPILGALFRRTSTTRRKTNLLLVLTPHVIRDHSDLQCIYRRKLEERQAFIRRHWAKKGRLPLHAVDFARGRGLLSEINRVALEAEREGAEAAPAMVKRAPLEGVALDQSGASVVGGLQQ
ncbi:MAG: type II secretion system secretin GspD [Deltaproteobacteria bacterium]|nr:type II secretion system secretin GspD [Deltaproteobacteria bacterium]